MKISFVILHYITINDTENCINSIKRNIGDNDFSIIVVDNGSPNKSGQLLLDKYFEDENVHVILCHENLGFAKGNNIGYQYVKTHENADYVVVLNSDTIIQNADFINQIPYVFSQHKCDVLGPDIITLENIHQNPFREAVLDKKTVKKRIRNKTIFLYYYLIKKKVKILRKINILENLFNTKTELQRQNISFDKARNNVVLQGACLIYSSKFIEREKNAFLPDTFMYGEEDLLAYYCEKKGYVLRYDPSLSILHKEGASTSKSTKSKLEKDLFFTKHALNGAKILLKYMNNDEVWK